MNGRIVLTPAPPANRESQCVPADGVEAARVWERAALTTIRRQAFAVTADRLVPHQATFARLTISRSFSSAACLFRQMM